MHHLRSQGKLGDIRDEFGDTLPRLDQGTRDVHANVPDQRHLDVRQIPVQRAHVLFALAAQQPVDDPERDVQPEGRDGVPLQRVHVDDDDHRRRPNLRDVLFVYPALQRAQTCFDRRPQTPRKRGRERARNALLDDLQPANLFLGQLLRMPEVVRLYSPHGFRACVGDHRNDVVGLRLADIGVQQCIDFALAQDGVFGSHQPPPVLSTVSCQKYRQPIGGFPRSE